jgi:hypothetical protein
MVEIITHVAGSTLPGTGFCGIFRYTYVKVIVCLSFCKPRTFFTPLLPPAKQLAYFHLLDSIVLDLVSQVRNVVLMNVYLGLGNSGGSGF